MNGHWATVQQIGGRLNAACSCGAAFDAAPNADRTSLVFVFSRLMCPATFLAWRRLKAGCKAGGA